MRGHRWKYPFLEDLRLGFSGLKRFAMQLLAISEVFTGLYCPNSYNTTTELAG